MLPGTAREGRSAFFRFDGGLRQVAGAKATAGTFATYPQDFLSLSGGLVDQVVGTAQKKLSSCGPSGCARRCSPRSPTAISC